MTQATGYKLPQSVISNTGWENADRTSFNDGTFAYTVDSFNRLVVGNFQLNIPQDRNIYNIEVVVTGKRNSYPTTLKIWAIDNTTGVEQAYALSPDFNSFTGNNTTFTLANTLFGTSWTVDEINNIKLALEADGELYIDSVALNVTYYDVLTQPTDGSPITGGTSGSDGNGVGIDGSVVCETLMDEFIQAQPFQLARSAKSDDTFFILKSFSLPNGVPITMEMVNGNLYGVAEQGNGSQEETVKITDIIHNYNGTGLVKIDFGSLSNRGLDFKFPYTSVSSNIKYHVGGAEFVLSNPAVMYTQFLKDSDIGCTISAPISVEDEGVLISSYLRSLNFTGLPITASSSVNINGGQDVTVNVTSPGDYVPPTITGTSSGTTGTSMATSLQWLHSISGVDRLLVVDVVTHETSTVTGVTYDGNALIKLSEQTRVSGNLRIERWYMTAPTVGVHTIQVNVNTFSYISGGARGFSGVDQTTPFDNVTVGSNGSSLSPINSVTTLANASIVIDALGTSLQPITHTEDSGQDVNFRITNSANRQISGGSQATGTSGTFNTNYELSVSTDWVMLSSAVKGIQLPTSVAGQTDIQFQDESINLGTSGTVDTVDFTGSGVTATRTGNTVTVNVPGGGVSVDEQVKVSATDTTTGYLDNKIELVSGTNTTVTKTILNPGANEKIQYQVNSSGGTLTGEQLHLSIFNGEFAGFAGFQNINFLNTVVDTPGSTIKKYGTFGMSAPFTLFNTGINRTFCYDYSLGKWFMLSVTNTSGGNYTLRLSMGDKSDLATETNFWTCSGFSSVSYPYFGFVIDLQELKLYITFNTIFLGTNTIDTTTISSIATYVFDLSSATGGTIVGTPTLFTGANIFPYTGTDIPQINSTTNKFITRDTDNKYTYNSSTGITSNIVVNYGDYSGKNIVHENDILHKDEMIVFTGSTSGSPTNVFYVESSVYPDSNTVLNT